MTKTLLTNANPGNLAVICESGERISYLQLNQDIEKFSEFFERRGLIFIVGGNHYSVLQCYLTAFESGLVPLLLDPSITLEQLEKLVSIYNPHWIFLPKILSYEVTYSTVWSDRDYSLHACSGQDWSSLHPELSLLSSTSGSTGSPKLVKLSRTNVLSNAKAISQYLKLSRDDRALAHLPLNYSFGLSVIHSHLYAGASVFLTDQSMMSRSFWENARNNQVTSISGVPYHFDMILRLGLSKIDIPTLKDMMQAGGKMQPEKISKFNSICQEQNIRFWLMYGQTEASPRIAYLQPRAVEAKPGSIGKSIPGGELSLKNELGEKIDGENVKGQLVFRGPNVFMGYANQAEDLSIGDINNGILYTGDLAYKDEDGDYYICGRLSRFIKVFGKRISLDDIEDFLSQQNLEGVATGQDDKIILALLEPSNAELKKILADRLGLHISAIKVIQIEEVPYKDSGKVDYQCLKTLLKLN